MMSPKSNKVLGNIYLMFWMGYIYAIEDSISYVPLKQKENYDKLKSKQKSEMEIYEDETYPLWRRALACARTKVINKRIPKDKRYSKLRTKEEMEQSSIETFN